LINIAIEYAYERIARDGIASAAPEITLQHVMPENAAYGDSEKRQMVNTRMQAHATTR